YAQKTVNAADPDGLHQNPAVAALPAARHHRPPADLGAWVFVGHHRQRLRPVQDTGMAGGRRGRWRRCTGRPRRAPRRHWPWPCHSSPLTAPPHQPRPGTRCQPSHSRSSASPRLSHTTPSQAYRNAPLPRGRAGITEASAMNSRTLHLFTLDSPYELAYPEEFADVGLDSPATAILTDFRAHPPLPRHLASGVEDARALLADGPTSVRAVADRAEHVRGLPPHHHRTHEAIMRRVGQGQRRADLPVRDLMVQREALMALDHDSLARTSVGKLLKLLHQEGQPQVLVVDQCGQRIRGLLSARDLAH